MTQWIMLECYPVGQQYPRDEPKSSFHNVLGRNVTALEVLRSFGISLIDSLTALCKSWHKVENVKEGIRPACYWGRKLLSGASFQKLWL